MEKIPIHPYNPRASPCIPMNSPCIFRQRRHGRCLWERPSAGVLLSLREQPICFAQGVYTYTKNQLGHDYGFLSAWFLGLAYIAIFLANATSLPLFARYFLGDVFRFDYLYKIFGYEVYLGEALLTAAAIILTGILCGKSKRKASQIVFVLVLVFTVTITVSFASALFHHDGSAFVFTPSFIPNTSAFSNVCFIAVVSVFIPFVGRAAIGWIVDVTTIGAIIIYGLLSWATWKLARSERKKTETCTGFAGIALMILFGAFLIIPNPLTNNAITPEAHFLFIMWAILGFVAFYHIVKRDRSGKFGSSVTVASLYRIRGTHKFAVAAGNAGQIRDCRL